jgi:hypothetical protein
MTTAPHFQRVLQNIIKHGFLLESDPKLPSVCGLITGEPMRGSWWSHPMAQTIFRVNETLEDHPDILIAKLVSGKVTFVHRNIWPEILAIGTAREDWQMRGISDSAARLLAQIDQMGRIRTDELGLKDHMLREKSKPGEVARELERKLLIYSGQVHTASGVHAKQLETWVHWSERIGCSRARVAVVVARERLDERLRNLNCAFSGAAKLPWH